MRQPLTVCADDVLDLRFSTDNSLFIVLQPEQTVSRRSSQIPIFAWSSRSLLTCTNKDAINFTIEHDVRADFALCILYVIADLDIRDKPTLWLHFSLH